MYLLISILGLLQTYDCDGFIYGPTWSPIITTQGYGGSLTLEGLYKAYEKEKIIPMIVPEYPTEVLYVTYDVGYTKINVTPGEFLQTESILKPPSLQWDCNPKKYYLVLFSDPDDPVVSGQNSFMWMVGNVHNCSVEDGEVIFPYQLTDLKHFVGPHRYIFTIYDQQRKMFYFEEKFYHHGRESRSFWNIDDMRRRYKLNSKPIAGNFFMVEECVIGETIEEEDPVKRWGEPPVLM